MSDTTIEQHLWEQFGRLDPQQQEKVLEFVRGLARPTSAGSPGRELVRFAGVIDKDDLEEISRAIEDGCEQVNLNDW